MHSSALACSRAEFWRADASLARRRSTEGFGTPCQVIGPTEAIAAEVLRHDPLAVALAILQIEWMTQSHYLDTVRDHTGIDPLFRSLPRITGWKRRSTPSWTR